MKQSRRAWALGCTALAGAVALAACGGSSGAKGTAPGPGSSSSGKAGGTLKVVMGTAPDSLDPGFGYTTQALEGDNMVYTPLLQYAFREGTPGTQLMPGLATRCRRSPPTSSPTRHPALRPHLLRRHQGQGL